MAVIFDSPSPRRSPTPLLLPSFRQIYTCFLADSRPPPKCDSFTSFAPSQCWPPLLPRGKRLLAGLPPGAALPHTTALTLLSPGIISHCQLQQPSSQTLLLAQIVCSTLYNSLVYISLKESQFLSIEQSVNYTYTFFSYASNHMCMFKGITELEGLRACFFDNFPAPYITHCTVHSVLTIHLCRYSHVG